MTRQCKGSLNDGNEPELGTEVRIDVKEQVVTRHVTLHTTMMTLQTFLDQNYKARCPHDLLEFLFNFSPLDAGFHLQREIYGTPISVFMKVGMPTINKIVSAEISKVLLLVISANIDTFSIDKEVKHIRSDNKLTLLSMSRIEVLEI